MPFNGLKIFSQLKALIIKNTTFVNKAVLK